MSQLSLFKELVSPEESDTVCQFYLDRASDIICEIRNASGVEKQFLGTQIAIAIDLYNKRGAEGELGHSEIGISRSYSSADVSPELLAKITPMAKTPWSSVRVIT